MKNIYFCQGYWQNHQNPKVCQQFLYHSSLWCVSLNQCIYLQSLQQQTSQFKVCTHCLLFTEPKITDHWFEYALACLWNWNNFPIPVISHLQTTTVKFILFHKCLFIGIIAIFIICHPFALQLRDLRQVNSTVSRRFFERLDLVSISSL